MSDKTINEELREKFSNHYNNLLEAYASAIDYISVLESAEKEIEISEVLYSVNLHLFKNRFMDCLHNVVQDLSILEASGIVLDDIDPKEVARLLLDILYPN